MTENERIKKYIEDCEHRIGNILGFMESNSDADIFSCEENIGVLKEVIIALEEIQHYRAIGTVEEFNRARQMEAVYGQVKWERDIAISQLEEIGACLGQKMDEFKALKEKNEPKKPFLNGANYECPNCNTQPYEDYAEDKEPMYCNICGQKLDWQ